MFSRSLSLSPPTHTLCVFVTHKQADVFRVFCFWSDDVMFASETLLCPWGTQLFVYLFVVCVFVCVSETHTFSVSSFFTDFRLALRSMETLCLDPSRERRMASADTRTLRRFGLLNFPLRSKTLMFKSLIWAMDTYTLRDRKTSYCCTMRQRWLSFEHPLLLDPICKICQKSSTPKSVIWSHRYAAVVYLCILCCKCLKPFVQIYHSDTYWPQEAAVDHQLIWA